MPQFLGNVEDFIALVKSRPALYNFTLDEFNDKKVTEQLWKEVAHEFKTNVNYCKNKWGVLRVSFARQMRNEKTNSRRSSETLINDWYLKDNMSFMRNFMRRRKKPRSNYSNDDYLSKSTTIKVKKESNLSNASLEIKNEPDDENESIASLEIFVDDENIVLPDCISLASTSSLSNNESARIENEFETSLCSGSSQKRKTIEENYPSSSSTCKKIKNRDSEPPSTRESNKTEDQLLLSSQRNTKEQEDLSQNQKDDVNLQFFKSILPDFNKLNGRRQRLLKQKFMIELNTFLDEQENES